MTNNERIRTIEYAKQMVEQQIKKIKQEQYIKDCIMDDLISNIKNYKSGCELYSMSYCWNFYHNSKNTEYKKDKEKYRKQKFLYEAFLIHIFTTFFLTNNSDKRFIVKDFYMCGYDGAMYEIQILDNITSKTYLISVPVRQLLTKNNCDYLRYGKIAVLVKTSENCYDYLFEDYDEDILGKKIKNYIDGVKDE